MTFQVDTRISYTGPTESTSLNSCYGFDLFIKKDEFYKIIEWLKENKVVCKLTQPLSEDNSKIDDTLWKHGGTNWFWLFIKTEEQSTLFRLTWEK